MELILEFLISNLTVAAGDISALEIPSILAVTDEVSFFIIRNNEKSVPPDISENRFYREALS